MADHQQHREQNGEIPSIQSQRGTMKQFTNLAMLSRLYDFFNCDQSKREGGAIFTNSV